MQLNLEAIWQLAKQRPKRGQSFSSEPEAGVLASDMKQEFFQAQDLSALRALHQVFFVYSRKFFVFVRRHSVPDSWVKAQSVAWFTDSPILIGEAPTLSVGAMV